MLSFGLQHNQNTTTLPSRNIQEKVPFTKHRSLLQGHNMYYY